MNPIDYVWDNIWRYLSTFYSYQKRTAASVYLARYIDTEKKISAAEKSKTQYNLLMVKFSNTSDKFNGHFLKEFKFFNLSIIKLGKCSNTISKEFTPPSIG